MVDSWARPPLNEEVAALKETEGGPIIIQGSATLTRSFSDDGLIDRHPLLVFPSCSALA